MYAGLILSRGAVWAVIKNNKRRALSSAWVLEYRQSGEWRPRESGGAFEFGFRNDPEGKGPQPNRLLLEHQNAGHHILGRAWCSSHAPKML